jgi:hypothetical protein
MGMQVERGDSGDDNHRTTGRMGGWEVNERMGTMMAAAL